MRRHLREDVRDLVLYRILSGTLPAAGSVGEEALAAELGVSRTPLREALFALAQEGLLEVEHGRGFIVKPLTATEVEEIYPLISALECFALVRASPFSEKTIASLRQANAEFASAATSLERVQKDTAWHTQLISGYANTRLTTMLRSLRHTIERYELAYMLDAGNLPRSLIEHDEIIDGLSDSAAAPALLEAHWHRGMEVLLARISVPV